MLTHFCGQRDLVQNGRKTIWQFLLKLSICTPYAPSILPSATHIHTHPQNRRMHVNMLNCFSHVQLFATPQTPLYVYIHRACQVSAYIHTPEDSYKTTVSSTTHK